MQETNQATQPDDSAEERSKADNQSVYQEPSIQKKTREGEAEKDDQPPGHSYSNKLPDKPDEETTNGVHKV